MNPVESPSTLFLSCGCILYTISKVFKDGRLELTPACKKFTKQDFPTIYPTIKPEDGLKKRVVSYHEFTGQMKLGFVFPGRFESNGEWFFFENLTEATTKTVQVCGETFNAVRVGETKNFLLFDPDVKDGFNGIWNDDKMAWSYIV